MIAGRVEPHPAVFLVILQFRSVVAPWAPPPPTMVPLASFQMQPFRVILKMGEVKREVKALFIRREVIVQSLLIVLAACLVGVATRPVFILNSLKGELALKTDQSVEAADAIYVINLSKAKDLFDEGEVVFLDSRSKSAYEESHILGALSIPLLNLVRNRIDLEEILPDKDTILITYCSGEGCDMAGELAEELARRGYRHLYVFRAGLPEWEAAGYPTEAQNEDHYR
jgi:rhodanese-related sulfurtransferase